MFYIIAILLVIGFTYACCYKGKAIGTIPVGTVESFSYSQSFFITYTHIKTDKHTILLAHKMTNIAEGDSLLMKRFQFKKILANQSRKSPEYCIDAINLLETISDFIASNDPKKENAFTKEQQDAVSVKK